MKPKPQWIIQADEALKRAAQRARELAARTHTPLHVMRDGRMVKLMPSPLDEAMLREEPPAYSARKP
jgi:hypothetical protein